MGDEVIVEFQGQNQASPRVVGFRSNPKACGFLIKLTRGDGTVMTDAAGHGVVIHVYASSGGYVSTTKAYLPASQSWSVLFDNPADGRDPAGYWLVYSATDGLATQYPYRYKAVQRWQTADLVRPGVYADTIPQFKTEAWPAATNGFVPADPWLPAHDWWRLQSTPVRQQLRVTSTVPYKPRYAISERTVEFAFWGHGAVPYCDGPLEPILLSGGSCRVLSDDGVFDLSVAESGIKPSFAATGPEAPAGVGIYAVEWTYTGVASAPHVCLPRPPASQEWNNYMAQFAFAQLTRVVSITALYDY